MLLSSSLNAGGTERFLFHKGSSLVFRENTGELHAPLITHPLGNLQPDGLQTARLQSLLAVPSFFLTAGLISPIL